MSAVWRARLRLLLLLRIASDLRWRLLLTPSHWLSDLRRRLLLTPSHWMSDLRRRLLSPAPHCV
jgi:hypothetical protein